MNNYNHITAKVEYITPEVAKELLNKNEHNRNQSKDNTQVIEKALIEDTWQVSGQTIIIASNGDLMDGQHRLQAVVNTGISMHHLVCRGVDSSVFSVIDTGKVRNGASVLSISGVSDASKVSALIKGFNAYKLKKLHTTSPKMTNSEILAEFNANEMMYLNALNDATLYPTLGEAGSILEPAQWAILILAMGTVDKGGEYLDALVNGEFPQVEEAIRLARKAGSGKINVARSWVALFSGYGSFVKGGNLPQSIRTTSSETKAGITRTVALTIPYPFI